MRRFVSVVVCIAVMAIAFTGCSENSVESSFRRIMKSLSSGDISVLNLPEDNEKSDDNKENREKVYKAIFKKISYKILSSEEKEDTAKVNVEVTTVNMKTIYSAYIGMTFAHLSDPSWDSDYSEVLRMINDKDAEKITLTACANLELKESGWVLSENNDEFYTAVYGGVF